MMKNTFYLILETHFVLKGALFCLRQFLATENPLEMMKNAFSFTLKALFVFKILKFLSRLVGHVEKELDYKDKANSKIYDLKIWKTNDCNTHTLSDKAKLDKNDYVFGRGLKLCPTKNFVRLKFCPNNNLV